MTFFMVASRPSPPCRTDTAREAEWGRWLSPGLGFIYSPACFQVGTGPCCWCWGSSPWQPPVPGVQEQQPACRRGWICLSQTGPTVETCHQHCCCLQSPGPGLWWGALLPAFQVKGSLLWLWPVLPSSNQLSLYHCKEGAGERKHLQTP